MIRLFDYNANQWRREDALVLLFFSDWEEIQNNPAFRSSVKERIAFCIENQGAFKSSLDEKYEVIIQATIQKLTELSPTLRTTKKASRLVWIRFAFTALRGSISPSEYFLERYARWRFKRSSENPGETIIRLSDTTISSLEPETFGIKPDIDRRYLFDCFFLMKNIPADLDCKSEWGYSPSPRKKDVKSAALEIADVIGTHALKNISDCINIAAKNGFIRGLKNNKINNRFESSISRSALAKILLKKYRRKLPYRESTVVKALSEFVACPNYRIRCR